MDPRDHTTTSPDSLSAGGIIGAAAKAVVEELVLSPEDVGAARARLERAISHATIEGALRPQVAHFQRKNWYGALGVLTGVACLFLIARNGRQSQDANGTAAVTTYATANGQRASITLPDGSTVALNVASRLDVPTDYGRGNRTVRLSGEALFTVRHHDGAPFSVVAGGITARVLGTAFIVRKYATDTAAVIAVREGKVAVRSSVVTARQEVEADPDGTVHARPADMSRFTFANGVLAFKRIPLRDAIVELDRWYDADVRVADPAFRSEPITATFAAGSRADLAAILEFVFDARVVEDGRVLTIYPK